MRTPTEIIELAFDRLQATKNLGLTLISINKIGKEYQATCQDKYVDKFCQTNGLLDVSQLLIRFPEEDFTTYHMKNVDSLWKITDDMDLELKAAIRVADRILVCHSGWIAGWMSVSGSNGDYQVFANYPGYRFDMESFLRKRS